MLRTRHKIPHATKKLSITDKDNLTHVLLMEKE